MRLFFDMGNSRIKWQWKIKEKSEYGFVHKKELTSSSSVMKDLAKKISSLLDSKVDKAAVPVIVSSVVEPNEEELFNQWLESQLGLKATYVAVEREFCGLKAGYKDLSRLGVDRWLAMLAVCVSKKVDSIIIDAGSALTIDYLNAAGQHEGGLIVPGKRLMCEAMNAGTYALKPESLTLPQKWEPACDTLACITNGLAATYAGLVIEAIEYYKNKWANSDKSLRVWVTGGDGSAIVQYCLARLEPQDVIYAEHLVLDGLALWFDTQC